MKKRIPLILFALLLFACSIPSIPTQPVATQPPVVTPPPVATNTPEVTNTPDVTDTPSVTEQPPAPVTNVTCNGLALYLDPVLASGYNCETVPETPEGIIVTPQYTKLTLQGYVLSGKFFEPHIMVFPVNRYTELLPDFMPGNITALQNLTGGATPDDSSMPFGSELPFLPTLNAGQIFHAQYQTVEFNSGSGIRYLTLLAQNYAAINNHDLFYTYQGLTSDGHYWVSAILPINNPVLPANGDNPPGGVSWEDVINNYGPYITDMLAQLNSQPQDAYSPSLESLDALVASITIQP